MPTNTESTIPSNVVARPARDILQTVRQQVTRDWWDMRRQEHELFTSQVVLAQIAASEPIMAQRWLERMEGINALELTPAAPSLAKQAVQSGLLPVTADNDGEDPVSGWKTTRLDPGGLLLVGREELA